MVGVIILHSLCYLSFGWENILPYPVMAFLIISVFPILWFLCVIVRYHITVITECITLKLVHFCSLFFFTDQFSCIKQKQSNKSQTYIWVFSLLLPYFDRTSEVYSLHRIIRWGKIISTVLSEIQGKNTEGMNLSVPIINGPEVCWLKVDFCNHLAQMEMW